ncbi:MAG: iron-containing alcohol dehydrogenase [Lentisphaeria bacterium]|nr:iron-containing alcohol dehydrogenase [Lentisphaeria bacterium]
MTLSEVEFRYESMLDEYPDTTFGFGPGAHKQLTGYLIAQRRGKCLVFAGGRSGSANRALPTVIQDFCRSQIDALDWPGIPPEPCVDDVRKMRDAIEKEKPDDVVAVGGGSVMDAAKAAWLSFQSGMDVQELFGVNRASEKFPDRKFQRVICVPTTAGTGSEATPYSNIVDPDSGVKKLIMEKAIIPEYSFINPKFTWTMPKRLTVTTALDALVHCVESVLNFKAENAHPNSVNWGLQGIRLIAAGLPVVLQKPDHELGRTFLSAAAVLGGMCIRNRPTSLPHLCSFSFYGKVSHGDAVAALLPPFWQYYLEEPAVREVTMKMAGIFGSREESTPEEVVRNAASFIAANGGPAKLSDLGCDRSIIDKAAQDAVLNPMKLQSCPRPVSPDNAAEIITGILSKAW